MNICCGDNMTKNGHDLFLPDSAFKCKTPFKRERVDLCRVEPCLRKNVGYSDIPCVRLCVIHSS